MNDSSTDTTTRLPSRMPCTGKGMHFLAYIYAAWVLLCLSALIFKMHTCILNRRIWLYFFMLSVYMQHSYCYVLFVTDSLSTLCRMDTWFIYRTQKQKLTVTDPMSCTGTVITCIFYTIYLLKLKPTLLLDINVKGVLVWCTISWQFVTKAASTVQPF